MKISQAYISPTLEKNFGKNFREKWNLLPYYDPNLPSVFLGLYTTSDLDALVNHRSYSVLLWGGGDMKGPHLEHVKNHLKKGKTFTCAYPGEFSRILTQYKIPHKTIYIPVKDYSNFKSVPLGEKIYVYRGINGNRQDYFQWNKVVKPIIDTFGENSVIYAENRSITDLIENFYKKSFIYVKPNPRGGCTAMFELGFMGRRTVGIGHIGLENFIQYNDISNLIDIIKKESLKIGKEQNAVSESTKKAFVDSSWLNIDFWLK